MKYLNLFIIALFISSCCSTKQVVENSVKEIAQLEENVSNETLQAISEPIVDIQNVPDPTNTIEEANVIKAEKFDHNPWSDLLQRHVSEAGNVDYKSFMNDRYVIHHYITSLGENMPGEDWSKEDKLAYWINAYNAMTIDLIIRNYPVDSIKDIKDPWKQRLWKLGVKWYNLDEIEHQILRKMNEPRIHFGIVCASFSCPKLLNSAFTASQVDNQLTKATREFLKDSNRNVITTDHIQISKIFQWFSKDFKENGSIIDFLNQYSDIQISSKAKKSYIDYNWDLNE